MIWKKLEYEEEKLNREWIMDGQNMKSQKMESQRGQLIDVFYCPQVIIFVEKLIIFWESNYSHKLLN